MTHIEISFSNMAGGFMHGLTTYSIEFSKTIPATLKIWMPKYWQKSSLSLMCLGDTYGAGRHVGAARTGVGIMQAWVLPGMCDLNKIMFTNTVCHIVVSFYLPSQTGLLYLVPHSVLMKVIPRQPVR